MAEINIFTFLFCSFVVFAPIIAKNVELRNPINQFSTEFYKETLQSNPDKTLIMSPFSIQIILGLLSSGAKGDTQKEIMDALHMNTIETIKSTFKHKMTNLKNIDGVTLNIANKIYVKHGQSYALAPNFKQIANDYFSSDIENIIFSDSEQAANTINNWIENETKHKIKDLFMKDSFDDRTRAVLVNAIYFLGNWEKPFHPQSVWNQKFMINDKEIVNVDLMYQRGDFPFLNSHELDADVLKLPYKSSNWSLVIILPKKINGIKALEDKIVNYNFENILKSLHTSDVHIAIPKFKAETKLELTDILPKLGVNLIFDQHNLELDGILKNKEKLFVSEAVHKAFIEVNERGTEAAAATGVQLMLVSAPRHSFTANHPFLYYLINGEDIIFCGKFMGK